MVSFPPSRSAAVRPSPSLVDEDPRTTLRRVLEAEEERLLLRRAELAEVRNALARLQSPDVGVGASDVARITVEVVPSLIQSLLTNTTGVVRNAVISPVAGASLDEELVAFCRGVVAGGREQRGVYDASILTDPHALEDAAAWASAGEVQRVCAVVPSEFAVYGDFAVVAVEVWGDPRSDYVLLRDPMLVQAFTALFDLTWERGHPFPSTHTAQAHDDQARLLELLARGLKDEAIGRYLGWSLRTVRRRVARLMDDLGARTRFQLGAQAARRGWLPEGDETGRAGRTAYHEQLGRGEANR